MHQIALTGITAKGFHGVHQHERENGQLFVVDLLCDLLDLDSELDDLAQTANYSQLSRDVVEILTGKPVNLLETLSYRISQKVLSYPAISRVQVTIAKPELQLAGQAQVKICYTAVKDLPSARAADQKDK